MQRIQCNYTGSLIPKKYRQNFDILDLRQGSRDYFRNGKYIFRIGSFDCHVTFTIRANIAEQKVFNKTGPKLA